MEPPIRRSLRGKPIPAALATTHHIALEGSRIRHFEQPLVDQLSPTDPLRLGLVASDPDVREALGQLKVASDERLRTLQLAGTSPEGADAHRGAVRFQQAIYEGVLLPAILKAEQGRRMLLALTRPDRAAMATAAGRPLDLDTRLALERVLSRMPLAKDAALWKVRAAGAVGYLVAAISHEVARIRAEREGGAVASGRDLGVYEFVQARPRSGQPASVWWAALHSEWNAARPDPYFRTVRAFQDAFRRGRRGTSEKSYEDARVLSSLEQRTADHQAALEALEQLVAAAELTPATRATLAAVQRGEDPPRWARQDLVDRLRKAAAKKS